jgi:hypothetical protein
MRAFGHFLFVSVLAALALSDLAAQAPDATTILTATREALGGEKRLSAVRSFVATGRTRQVRGDNLVPIEFEISCELPDKYIRRDEIPAQESGPTTIGFNGAALIQQPVPPVPAFPARAGGRPAPSPAQLGVARNARVTTVKQDFVRLTLGMFATSFSSYPLTFSYVGEAEAPQGKADVIEVRAPGWTPPGLLRGAAPLPPDATRGTGPPPPGPDGARGRARLLLPSSSRAFSSIRTHTCRSW